MQGVREQGIITKFISDRGFGFIAREGCPDLFVHISEFEPGAEQIIQPGMLAEFSVDVDERGRFKAVGVELLGERGELR